METQYQTRAADGGTDLFDNFDDAYNCALNNPSIWKISFNNFRWLKLRKQGYHSVYSTLKEYTGKLQTEVCFGVMNHCCAKFKWKFSILNTDLDCKIARMKCSKRLY